MKISLVVCTYMRPESLKNLLKTVVLQSKIPDEVLIIDGSTNDETKSMLAIEKFETLNLHYFKVSDDQRGLTKQRNFGVAHVAEEMEVVAFLDDDTELDSRYFYEINKTFEENKDAIGVSGYITNEVKWERINTSNTSFGYFTIDGWSRRDDLRIRLRKILGLMPNVQPSTIGPYANERAVGSLPPSGKVYKVDYLQGAMMAYRKSIFEKLSFSHYFEGYGLYEDKDFSLHARKYGPHYIDTNAKLAHYHDPLGRPNYIEYGKMTIRNGWRVWRVAIENPSVINIFRWYIVSTLLMYSRLGGFIKGPDRKKALEEFIGRHLGLISLLFKKPSLD